MYQQLRINEDVAKILQKGCYQDVNFCILN